MLEKTGPTLCRALQGALAPVACAVQHFLALGCAVGLFGRLPAAGALTAAP